MRGDEIHLNVSNNNPLGRIQCDGCSSANVEVEMPEGIDQIWLNQEKKVINGRLPWNRRSYTGRRAGDVLRQKGPKNRCGEDRLLGFVLLLMVCTIEPSVMDDRKNWIEER